MACCKDAEKDGNTILTLTYKCVIWVLLDSSSPGKEPRFPVVVVLLEKRHLKGYAKLYHLGAPSVYFIAVEHPSFAIPIAPLFPKGIEAEMVDEHIGEPLGVSDVVRAAYFMLRAVVTIDKGFYGLGQGKRERRAY